MVHSRHSWLADSPSLTFTHSPSLTEEFRIQNSNFGVVRSFVCCLRRCRRRPSPSLSSPSPSLSSSSSSLFVVRCSSLFVVVRCSLFVVVARRRRCSLLFVVVRCSPSLLIVRWGLFVVRCSLFVVRCSLFVVRCSLFVVRCSFFALAVVRAYRCLLFVVRCCDCVVALWLLSCAKSSSSWMSSRRSGVVCYSRSQLPNGRSCCCVVRKPMLPWSSS